MRIFFVLILATGLSFEAFASQQFTALVCRDGGYNAENIQFRLWEEVDRYLVKGEVGSEWFEFLLKPESCKLGSQDVVFECADKSGGTVVVDGRHLKYGAVKISSTAQEEENTYEPLRDEYPIWYQRVISISLSGGELTTPFKKTLKVNVNFHDKKHEGFRSYCYLDGEVVPR
jgi:hypothetical protein